MKVIKFLQPGTEGKNLSVSIERIKNILLLCCVLMPAVLPESSGLNAQTVSAREWYGEIGRASCRERV